MARREETRSDLFWTGFPAGAAIGGAVGALMASELGRRALAHVEDAARDMQGRYNGRAAGRPEASGDAEPEVATGETSAAETPLGGAGRET